MNANINGIPRSDVIKSRAEALSCFRAAFAAIPGSAYAFERRSGIPRSFITQYLLGQRPGIRGKAKIWAQRIRREAERLSRATAAA